MKKTKRIALLGLTVALAIIMSYIEVLFPLNFAVPGIKMGLANIVIVFVLYRMSLIDAVTVSLVRVFLVSLLFGNFMSLAYSLAGAVLSLALMVLLKKTEKFSVVGVSVAGGVMHNAGQLLMAVILMGTAQIAYYLPVLVITGTVTGVLIGLVSALVINRVKKI